LVLLINIEDNKYHGLAKYFYPTGELNYEVNYKKGLAINGYKYQLNGTKIKMTEAHFYNLKIPYNN
jgi:antitoxin component YwqK of YwqJK toxin-antitoxin module